MIKNEKAPAQSASSVAVQTVTDSSGCGCLARAHAEHDYEYQWARSRFMVQSRLLLDCLLCGGRYPRHMIIYRERDTSCGLGPVCTYCLRALNSEVRHG